MTLLQNNWGLALLLLATLLVLVLLAIVVSAALRSSSTPASTGGAKALRLPVHESMRRTFRQAVKLIEANLAGGAERYNLSWTLLLNDSTMADVPLAQAGLRSDLGEIQDTGAQQGAAWHFFDKGVVVQVRTGSPDEGDGDKSWETLLALCRDYRPQRPFDAIVLAVPCSALLDSGSGGQAALVARAQALHRRLWLAQNRLALRFPVHLMVTECEGIPGFARFGAAVPEPLKRAILGWASPFEPATPYRDQWADSAIDHVTSAVANACAELSALEEGDHDSIGYLLLPSELERLRAGVKAFCEELMRPSAYHESFLLRGIYLTGDGSPAAQLQAPGMGDRAANAALARLDAPFLPMPVFLRDIFERKVFPEVGLVRASRQRLRQPAARRLGYWLAVLVPLVWGIGIGIGTYNLSQKQAQLRTWLERGNARAVSPGAGLKADGAALDLQEVERIAALRFYAIAIPGSWPALSDIDEKITERLNRNFAHVAVTNLRLAALARLNTLTGTDYQLANDNITGSGQCAAPAVAPAEAGIDLRTLPEFDAMLTYLNGLDQLDQGLEAMRRLREPDRAPASGKDLALALHALLNYEAAPTFAGAAALYRDEVRRSPEIPEEFIHRAAACAIDQLAKKMYAHLFERNPLMLAEQGVNNAYKRILAIGAQDAAARTVAWRDLQKGLEDQQALLAKGGGAWMAQNVLALGPDQQALLRRVGANHLLGDHAAQHLAGIAESGFAGFQSAWSEAVSGSEEDGSNGLVWKEQSWNFTPVRKKLVSSVGSLFAPGYMRPALVQELPGAQKDRTVNWDKTQLDNAEALIDARKVFLAGPFVALPLTLQPPSGKLVDALLVGAVQNALAQAVALGEPGLPSAAADAERDRVLAIRHWLHDINADALVGKIDALLAADAQVRLERLDAFFAAAQLYLPRDPRFDHWDGRKGVMVEAFGDGDPAALQVYLAQQKEFIETIGPQAQGVLNELASVARPGANGPAAMLVARWQALGTDLLRYHQKSPASSRLALENFIGTGGADLDLSNCADKLSPRAARPVTDLFAERLAALQQNLLARCRALAASAAQRQWQQFAEAWNRDLGQRALFTSAGNPGEPAAPADRDAVGALLKLYDNALETGNLAGKLAGRPPYQADPQLRRVRNLLAPLYPADATQAAGLDVAVAFRENRIAERGANQVIDWSLTVGQSTVRLADPPKALHWEPGLPVSLSLRFARDGGSVPVADPSRPGMTVSDRTVTFRFTDPWALFTFINAYRDSDGPGDDGRAPLLRLAFGLAPAAGLPGAADGEARVFLRLRVSAPGTFKPLAWPAAFPAQLPVILDPVKSS